jgi:hypothetical protein
MCIIPSLGCGDPQREKETKYAGMEDRITPIVNYPGDSLPRPLPIRYYRKNAKGQVKEILTSYLS